MKNNTNIKEFCPFCNKEIHTYSKEILGKHFIFRTKCLCQKKLEEKDKNETIYIKKKMQAQNVFSWNKIGERVKNCSFCNFEQRNGTEKMFSMAVNYVENFEKYKQKGIGLLFLGKPGTGKTHLSFSIANELMKKNYTCIFISANKLINKMKESQSFTAYEKTSDLINFLANVDLLVIDDIGSHKWTETNEQILYQIIDERYANSKPIIVSTNCNADDTNKLVGDRNWDRLMGSTIQIVPKALSYRIEEKENRLKTLSN